ncbi:MAG: ABC transporter permease [Actinomycetota bacterium]
MAQVTSEPIAVGPLSPQGGEVSSAVVGRSPWELFWRRFRKDRFALASIVFIGILALIAIFAGVIAKTIGHGPNDLFLREMTDEFGLPQGPNGEFWFGADLAGRDLFVRVIYGARTSLTVAFIATGISVVIGVLAGLLAGFYRGKVDTVISRTIDIVLSLPILLISLGLVSACGLRASGCLGGLIKPGLTLVSLVIGLFSWPYIARIVRGQILSLREKEFIEAARAAGAGNLRIITRELLPNVIAPIIVYTTLIIPNNILFEAALSFLGIGVPATTPSWGRALNEAGEIFQVAWWMMLFPGLFLFLTTLAFNLVGDGLRDALDPRTGG